MTVGVALRELRRSRRLTLEGLAEAVGISGSFLSRLERDEVDPSLKTLTALARYFEVSLAMLFAERGGGDRGPTPPVPRARRDVLHSPDGKVRIEKLARRSASDAVLDVSIQSYQPGSVSSEAFDRTHPGEIHLLVLSGEMTVWVGGFLYEVGEGDSVCFDASLPHRWENRGDREARVQVCSARLNGAVT